MGQVTIRFITNCESFCSTTLFWYKKSKNKNADFINKNIRRCRGNSAGISRWLKFNSWLLGGVLSSLFEPFERGESWAWRRVPIATKSLGVENATYMCFVSTGTKIQISYENEWERVVSLRKWSKWSAAFVRWRSFLFHPGRLFATFLFKIFLSRNCQMSARYAEILKFAAWGVHIPEKNVRMIVLLL